ncbi:uncharacterized protein [Littorina saxatilis]|uniref:uncharacterized protein n=1 Tax=Littorina saxatilis TaxID=31220 RepID=UPI0038B65671
MLCRRTMPLWVYVIAAMLLPPSLESTKQELRTKCPPGRFGPRCMYQCHCKGTNSCSLDTGSCASGECARGYVGDGCQNVNLASNANTSSKNLVDSNATSCQTEGLQSQHWIDLREKLWLRRFRIIVTEIWKDNKGAQVIIQVTNSSNAKPEWMASSNARITWSGNGEVDIFLEYAVQGRYLWIRGSNLIFCEVYVFGGRNVALYRPTAQSSTLDKFTSSLAVDGVTSQRFADNSCSHTKEASGPIKLKEIFKESVSWWWVNLTSRHVISRIVIYSRLGYEERLRWFHLKASSVDPASLLTVYRSPDKRPPSILDILPVTPMSLAVLRVDLYGRGRILTLCEVQLFGECPDMTYGTSCNNTCDCADQEEVCDSFSGSCLSGKAGDGGTPIPVKDREDDKESESDSLLTGIVVGVILVVAFLLLGLFIALWLRRRNNKRNDKTEESTTTREPPPQDDDTYEVVETTRNSQGDFISRDVSTAKSNSNNARPSFRQKFNSLTLCGANSTKKSTDARKKGGMRSRKRGPMPLPLRVAASDVYDDANSSGGACAGGDGSGEMYEVLGDREYESPYTVFTPAVYNNTL